APTPPAATGPTVAACTVLAPTYTVDGKNPPQAGLMFAVKVGDKQLLVTAHSVFGLAGGLPTQIPAAELPKRVTAMTAKDTYTPATLCARSNKVVVVADAAPMGNGVDATRDIALFEVPAATGYDAQSLATTPLAPLAFAAKAPKVGDKVYLLASVKGKTGTSWPAKVVQADAGYLFFQYDDGTLDLVGTTGAPVVDATGGLLGVNLSVGKMDDGALIGGATQPAATKQRIEAAAKAP
ncbi:MAG: trypsin-like peptidase domain-containing protein, partial [Myxococcota bacterium]